VKSLLDQFPEDLHKELTDDMELLVRSIHNDTKSFIRNTVHLISVDEVVVKINRDIEQTELRSLTTIKN